MTDLPPGFVLEGQENQQTQGVPSGFVVEQPGAIEKAANYANRGVNLGLAYMQGRTFGIGPKAMSALGAGIAKPILETGEKVNNLMGGNYEAPTYGDLYKTGVNRYQEKVNQSRIDDPYLSAGAEMAGGIKTTFQAGKTGIGKGVSNWISGPEKAAGPLTRKAALFLQKAGRGALVGEAGYRAYKVGTAVPGQESNEALHGWPIGGIAGGVAPVLSGGVNLAVKSAAPKIDDALKPIVDLASKYNIPVSLDQITSSRPVKTLQKISQELPFSSYGGFRDKQMSAFNRAIIKTFGQDADRFTPELMDKAFKDVGREFDSLGRGKTFAVGDNFLGAVDDILSDSSAYTQDALDAFNKETDVILKNIDDSGMITGERLSHLRSRLNSLARKTNDNDKATLFRDLENAVIDIMTAGDDTAKAALSDAKRKYKNLLVVEPLTKSGKAGNISPSQLSTRVGKIYGRQYTTGSAGEIGDLARVGKELLPELGGSDTMQKTMFAGGAAYFEPTTTISTLAGNRAFQKWINQNPRLIERLMREEFEKTMLPPPASLALGAAQIEKKPPRITVRPSDAKTE